MLLDRLGVDNVNAFLKNHGCTVTRCIRKLYDWDAIKANIHNQIAAGEITDLLKAAAQGKLISPEADADLLGIMKKQQYIDKIPHRLPKGAVTATKSGSLDEVSHDSGVVWLPSGDWFALSIFTSDLVQSEDGPERSAVNDTMSRMSLACYNYAAG
jgi:beta-lactamase class A